MRNLDARSNDARVPEVPGWFRLCTRMRGWKERCTWAHRILFAHVELSGAVGGSDLHMFPSRPMSDGKLQSWGG